MWEFQNASGDFPPDSAIATPAVLLKDVVYPMEDCGFPEWDVCWTGLDFCKYRHRYLDGNIYLAWLCLLERPVQWNVQMLYVPRLDRPVARSVTGGQFGSWSYL